jgi:hypothetical protein
MRTFSNIIGDLWTVILIKPPKRQQLLFFQYVFTLTTGRMANVISDQRSTLEIQNPVEVLILDLEMFIDVKN